MEKQTHQITVGYASIPWARFQPATDCKEVVLIENGEETVVGQTTEEIVEVKVNHEVCWQRTQKLQTDEIGERRGVSVVCQSTFAPVSFLSTWNEEIIHVEYSGEGATIVKGPFVREDSFEKGQIDGLSKFPNAIDSLSPKKTIFFNRPLFDNHSVEMILRLLPLKIGYEAEFAVFHPRHEQEMPIYINVLTREQAYKGPGISCEAWKVETHFGSHVQWYWISTEEWELLKQASYVAPDVVMEFRRK